MFGVCISINYFCSNIKSRHDVFNLNIDVGICLKFNLIYICLAITASQSRIELNINFFGLNKMKNFIVLCFTYLFITFINDRKAGMVSQNDGLLLIPPF